MSLPQRLNPGRSARPRFSPGADTEVTGVGDSVVEDSSNPGRDRIRCVDDFLAGR